MLRRRLLACCLAPIVVALCAGCLVQRQPALPAAETPAGAFWSGRWHVPGAGEGALAVTAAAPGTSWAEKGREAAVLSVWLDGQCLGDIVLFMGAQAHRYSFMAGPLEPGEHQVALMPAPGKGVDAPVTVTGVEFSLYRPGDPLYAAVRYSPLLYGRPVMNRSDTPLLAYHEKAEADGKTTISYTVIFSNEDGGTNPPGLMARWGRVTDIEWVYSVTLDGAGRRIAEEIQAKDHKTVPFAGQRRGEHPLLRVSTDNNMVSDSGTSPLLFAPVFAEALPAASPREAMMDLYPWSYQVMGEERAREGMEAPGQPTTSDVSDPRNYLYVTYKARFEPASPGSQCGLQLAASAYDSASGAWYASDHGRPDLRVSLDGWRRIAIELPPGTKPEQVTQLQFRVYPTSGKGTSPCREVLEAVGPVFMLDESYRPQKTLWSWQGSVALDADEATREPAELTLGR